jgi:hypothetical protein
MTCSATAGNARLSSLMSRISTGALMVDNAVAPESNTSALTRPGIVASRCRNSASIAQLS